MDMEQPQLRDSNTRYTPSSPKRHGGMAGDLSRINRLKREIQDVQDRLEAANRLLRKRGEIKSA